MGPNTVGDEFKDMIQEFISAELEQLSKDLALIEKKLDLPAGSARLEMDFTLQQPSRRLTIQVYSSSSKDERIRTEALKALEDLSREKLARTQIN